MANILDDYKNWMPLKDMANVGAAVKATIPSALETSFVIPARPLPSIQQAREELSHLERPTALPKPEVTVEVVPEVAISTPKRGWSWVNLTLMGNRPAPNAPRANPKLENNPDNNKFRKP